MSRLTQKEDREDPGLFPFGIAYLFILRAPIGNRNLPKPRMP